MAIKLLPFDLNEDFPNWPHELYRIRGSKNIAWLQVIAEISNIKKRTQAGTYSILMLFENNSIF